MRRVHSVYHSILLSTLVVLLVPLLILGILFTQIDNALRKETQDAAQQRLEQCVSLVDTRLSEIKKITLQLSFDPAFLAYATKPSPYQDRSTVTSVRQMHEQLSAIKIANDFIDSINVYFPASDVLISTNGSYLSMREHYGALFQYGDLSLTQWSSLLRDHSYLQKVLPATKVQKGVLSQQPLVEEALLYLSSIPYQRETKAQVYVLLPLSHIEAIFHETTQAQEGQLLVYDETGQLLLELLSPTHDAPLEPSVLQQQFERGETRCRIDGEEYDIASVTSPANNWRYIAAHPRSQGMSNLSRLRTYTALLALLAAAVGVLLAVFSARRNAKPVRNILDQLRASSEQSVQSTNEYTVLSGFIQDLFADNTRLTEDLNKQLPLLKTTFMDKLLSGWFHNEEEIHHIQQLLSFAPLQGSLFVCILRIEAPEPSEMQPIAALSAAKRSVQERLEQLLHAPVYYQDMDFDKRVFVFALRTDEPHSAAEEVLALTAFELSRKTGLGCTFYIAPAVPSLTAVGDGFERARDTMLYTRKKPEQSAVLWAVQGGDSAYFYPLALEERLLNSVHSGAQKDVESILSRLFSENFEQRSLSGDTIRRLYHELQGTMHKLCVMLAEESSAVPPLQQEIERFDDGSGIDELWGHLHHLFAQLTREFTAQKETRADRAIDHIRDFIETEYADAQLGLTEIAEKFGFAPSYLSQLFKEKSGENLSSYLEAVRIRHACALLEAQEPVSAIAQQVGYNSIGVFRQAFKRVMGCSPSAYRDMPKDKGHSL